MKALLALSCLVGMSSALGGGGCPLNYGDSCGWMESDDGEFCFKPFFHGKSIADAAALCWNLGTYECHSQLLAPGQVEQVKMSIDPMDLPKNVRLDGRAFCATDDCTWIDFFNQDVVFPGPPYTETPDFPRHRPNMYEDHHVISAVWDVDFDIIDGHTPAQDRVSFICSSCVTVDHSCPVICEYCIPHMPRDSFWSEWGEWSDCTGTCNPAKRTRSRRCYPAKWGGEDKCIGPEEIELPCLMESLPGCPSEPMWGEWESWGKCSDTPTGPSGCGWGRRIRFRECIDPAITPMGGDVADSMCEGGADDAIAYDSCLRDPCATTPVAPTVEPVTPTVRSDWCSWETDCSAFECGAGITNRFRRCECPYGNQDTYCTAGEVETAEPVWCVESTPCNQTVGNWGAWGEFSDCSPTCGTRYNVSYRDCDADICIGDRFNLTECDDPAPACDYSETLLVLWDNVDLAITNLTAGASSPLSLDVCPYYLGTHYYTLLPDFIIGSVAAKFGRFPAICGGEYIQFDNFGSPDDVLTTCRHPNFDDILGSGWARSDVLSEPRLSSAVVQLNEFEFMLIGGDYYEPSSTSEIVQWGRDDSVPGPNLPPEMWGMIGFCAAAFDNGRFVVVAGGGRKRRGTVLPSKMVFMYDFETHTWTRLPDMEVARYNHHCAIYPGEETTMVMLAALGDTGTRSAETIVFYDTSPAGLVAGAAWALDDEVFPFSLVMAKSVYDVEEDRLLVAGGFNMTETGYDFLTFREDSTYDIYAYYPNNNDGERWTLHGTLPPTGVHGAPFDRYYGNRMSNPLIMEDSLTSMDYVCMLP